MFYLFFNADYFQNLFFFFLEKILSEILSECQTVLIQIKPDILSGLTCFQTVCKGYQQTTHADKELTLKAPITTAADNKFCDTFPSYLQK